MATTSRSRYDNVQRCNDYQRMTKMNIQCCM